ncbi:MAG: carbamoyl-phosphate synthase large subunit [Deltaproteobacteria bacterium]|nr:carbamoyl-phosphate synthase large subunit [Deltaproteobacteria bacterium]
MPKRSDIKKIMVIGAGPIVIGQACEFDYSGTQGVKALKSEGYEICLINSNPATIMTDPDLAHRTYIEPITLEICTRMIEKERPDALLPTLGGQTALNMALQLHETGVLQKYGIELIGAHVASIKKAEDRLLFKQAIEKIGLKVPRSAIINNTREALTAIKTIGFPAILRPAFTLGGTGGNVSYNIHQYKEHIKWALDCSPTDQVLVEQSVIGWKEFELEVVRDKKDNVIIICSIENFDAMGIHTGDSITVAPAQTLTDKEYQMLRNASVAIIREIGVDTGGSNIQFAVNPVTGEMLVIEMNPRVSRSSALASKATGFPIAKIAAKLSVGYTLDELKNDITKNTPASFEPSIDYVVTKIPRFTFEKFSQAEDILGTQMKSVGEVMGIGRTFKESLQKAMRSLETGIYRFKEKKLTEKTVPKRKKELFDHLITPRSDRLLWIAQALRFKIPVKEISALTHIDPWFIDQISQIIQYEFFLKRHAAKPLKKSRDMPQKQYLRALDRAKNSPLKIDPAIIQDAKRMGFSDRSLSKILNKSEDAVRRFREKNRIIPVYKKVDTCAAEFEAHTPYLYSTYESENEANPTRRKKVIILGGGPNRIGQGLEFDYCCCHASFSLKEDGYEVIMVNCNPETVSTDYDTSDRLYFEPLTKEDIIRIIEEEKPLGIIVQFGGQTPLKLSVPLEKWGAKILGTSSDSIDRVEDRERFSNFISKLKLRQPFNGMARSFKEALAAANKVGYPIIVRPSYVLGGRAMEIVYDEAQLKRYMKEAVLVTNDRPVLIDRFLEKAIEIDVDALCDGRRAVIGGIMEHIEEAGVHSGDSACCLPPHSLHPDIVKEIIRQTKLMALELHVVGLMNVQFAVQKSDIFILEVNPRASRTVPFVSKATGKPLAKIAAKLMMGKTLDELGFIEDIFPKHISVKEAVFPFNKFSGVDTLLGPEMKSTGEVMGIDQNFGMAFAKAQIAAFNAMPKTGKAFISVRDRDKSAIVAVATRLIDQGFELVTTKGTGLHLLQHGLKSVMLKKHYEGTPNILKPLLNKKIAMVINTHEGKLSAVDSYDLRRTALTSGTPYFVTLAAAEAAVAAIAELKKTRMDAVALQDYHTDSRVVV